MKRIFITGSADGLGQLAAKALIEQGHTVVLHARNPDRARDALKKNPAAVAVVTGDLSSIEETKDVARQANELGRFDAVIHNAGVYQTSGKEIFAVNTLAPYILTCLVQKPGRLVYLTSGLHMHGHPKLEDFKNGPGRITYSDSKLHVTMLCMTVARNGRMFTPMWSIPVGSLQKWEAAAHLMTCKKDTKHRSGWQQATKRMHELPAVIFFIKVKGGITLQLTMCSCRRSF